MLSFRKKIFLSQCALIAVFIAILFPLLGLLSSRVLRSVYTGRVLALVKQLKTAGSQEEMVEFMHTRSDFLLQRGSLLDSDGDAIYTLPSTSEASEKSNPEILNAIKFGKGYDVHFSPLYREKFLYIAEAFTLNGKNYILYINFRGKEIDQIQHVFEMSTLGICIALLLINSLLITTIIHRVMRPVQEIIDAIRPFKEGKEELLPRIVLNESMQAGEFSKLASTFNSLTDRIQKQIEYLTRQREETEEILESIGEGIIAADPSARVTFANRIACRMLGMAPELVIGQTLDSIKSNSEELSKKCHELIVHALQTSEPTVQTWIVRGKSSVYLDLISAPLAHKDGALLVFQDKTSDYRIVELGKDFVANASHELRTPITIIRGFAETLQDLPDISQEMLHDIVEKIVRTCGRLDKLVRSLLTLADIENLSEDRFKPVDLIPMLENCVHTLLTVNPTAQVHVKVDVHSAVIIADADLFELAIMNILENGVKYSQPPAKINISVEVVAQEVYLQIRDHGIGISEKDLPHIFERFYTVDKARSRKSGGTGLGLSIVKTIIDKHRGKIIATSELGKGSTFTFVLPVQPSK